MLQLIPFVLYCSCSCNTVRVIVAFNIKLMWSYYCIFQMKWQCNIALLFPTNHDRSKKALCRNCMRCFSSLLDFFVGWFMVTETLRSIPIGSLLQVHVVGNASQNKLVVQFHPWSYLLALWDRTARQIFVYHFRNGSNVSCSPSGAGS